MVLCYRVIAVVISVFVASCVAPAVVVANIEKSFASSTLKGESKRVCLSDKMTRYLYIDCSSTNHRHMNSSR